MRQLSFLWIAAVGFYLGVPGLAQATDYTTPSQFMDLFFDFTGSNEPGYPAGQPTMGQMLTQSVIANEPHGTAPASLILIVGSDIYVYDFGERRPARA